MEHTEILQVIEKIDRFGGTNYGCYPIRTEGDQLLKKLESSNLWEKNNHTSHFDKRNDNQVDIYRGSDFFFTKKNSDKKIYVYIRSSRSGKKQTWSFRCTFSEPIEF